MKTYFFKVKLSYAKRIWRKIEIPGRLTLDNLHSGIQGAFGFASDHPYSFFMSGKAWDNRSDFEYYSPELSEDPFDPRKQAKEEKQFLRMENEFRHTLDERNIEPHEATEMLTFFHELMPKPRLKLPASKVRIETLNLKPKQKFLYLFDYGDEWHFEVEFLKEGTTENFFFWHIVDSRGKAPEQYQDNEDGIYDGKEEAS